MARESRNPLSRFLVLGTPVTLAMVHCAHCSAFQVVVLDGAWLEDSQRRRRLLRADGLHDAPVLRCRACESADLHLVQGV